MAFDEHAIRDSFLLSNAIPQDAVMNRSSWRRLENWVRKLAVDADSVCQSGRSRLMAVIMPNAETGDRSPESFIVTRAELEKRAGLMFFSEVPSLEP